MEGRERNNGVVGPMILIFIGVVFLLNNIGVLEVDFWRLVFQLWPLLLIAGGLDLLIGRRSAAGSVLVLLVTILMLAGGVWYLNVQTPMVERSVQGDRIERPLDGAERASVSISPGAAFLRLDSGADPDMLLEGTVDLRRGERLDETFSEEGATVVYGLRSRNNSSMFVPGINEGSTWEIRVNQEIPLELKVDTGAGESVLRLSRLNLANLDVNTGVGRTTVTLPGRGRYQAQIETGIGQVIVRVPAGLGARIQANAGLGGVDVAAAFTSQGNHVYLSPGYDTADNRVDLQINGGIGQIVVEELRE